MYNEGTHLTCTASTALTEGVRVKLKAESASPPLVEVAGAADLAIGHVRYAVAAGELASVRLCKAPGVHEAIAAAAITTGAALYGAADGKVTSSSSGDPADIRAYAFGDAAEAGDTVSIVYL